MLVDELTQKKDGLRIETILTDQYGNYFAQKLLEQCSAKQRFKFLSSLNQQEFIKVSQDSIGTRTIQKCI